MVKTENDRQLILTSKFHAIFNILKISTAYSIAHVGPTDKYCINIDDSIVASHIKIILNEQQQIMIRDSKINSDLSTGNINKN